MSSPTFPSDSSRSVSANGVRFGARSVSTITQGHHGRQLLTWVLGLVWLIDAALQYRRTCSPPFSWPSGLA